MTKGQARRCYYAALGVGKSSDSLTRMAATARFEEWWRLTHPPKKRRRFSVATSTMRAS